MNDAKKYRELAKAFRRVADTVDKVADAEEKANSSPEEQEEAMKNFVWELAMLQAMSGM